jgi:hypothetical protein
MVRYISISVLIKFTSRAYSRLQDYCYSFNTGVTVYILILVLVLKFCNSLSEIILSVVYDFCINFSK